MRRSAAPLGREKHGGGEQWCSILSCRATRPRPLLSHLEAKLLILRASLTKRPSELVENSRILARNALRNIIWDLALRQVRELASSLPIFGRTWGAGF